MMSMFLTLRRRVALCICPELGGGGSGRITRVCLASSVAQASSSRQSPAPKPWEALQNPAEAEAYLSAASGAELREMAVCLLAGKPLSPAEVAARAQIELAANASEALFQRLMDAAWAVRSHEYRWQPRKCQPGDWS